MNYTEIEIRNFTSDEIYYHLLENFSSFDLLNQIILCDELLLRNLPIKHIKQRFEFLIRKMKTQELVNIDAYDFNYSKATVFVAIDELIKRGKKPLEWLYISKFEGQKGPVNRLEIDKLIERNEIDNDSLLWRIGMEEWKPLSEMPYLEGLRYYDQEFSEEPLIIPELINEKNQSEKTHNSTTNTPIHKREPTFSYSIVPGVMELVSFPMWIILVFMLFFTGFTSQLGVVLPFIFSILVLISVIPVGIGLLARKKWAWSIKIATAMMTIVLILFKLIIDHAGGWWDFILIYQLIILGLLFYGRKTYEVTLA